MVRIPNCSPPSETEIIVFFSPFSANLCSEHPLSALSHGNVSVVSSFNFNGVGDAFSDCIIGERTR